MSFDPGLTSNQSIFTLFPDLCWNKSTVWSLWRLFFGVCPRYIQRISFPRVSGTLLPIKDLFIYLFSFFWSQALNFWMLELCHVVLRQSSSLQALFPPLPGPWGDCFCFEPWSAAEQWNIQEGTWKHARLVPFTCTATKLSHCSPLIPGTDSRSPPTNLFIDSESPTSLQVHWKPPEGRVQHYKITYSPVSDTGAQQTVRLQLLCRGQAPEQRDTGTISHPREPCSHQ